MLRLALKMMMGDRAKFIAIIIGLTFAAFIITQQASIFVGLMTRTYGFIEDTSQPDVWVMDPEVQYIDDIKTIPYSNLFQVRSINQVAWAVPMYRGLLKARLKNGNFQLCNIVGIDDATLIGGPPYITEGNIVNLRRPNAVIVNEAGAHDQLAPMQLGEIFEINNKRAKVEGFCKTKRTFLSNPVIYTTFFEALRFSPKEIHLMTFVLVKAAEGVSPEALCKKIEMKTGLAAYTAKQFTRLTVLYYLINTGIAINFGIAVLLGIIIGAAIAGQTFYNFAHDNRHYFATLKAMGCTKHLLTKMVMVQALLTASISWGLGVGISTIFGFLISESQLSFRLPWWLLLGSGAVMIIITLLTALIGLYKIIRLEPSAVFQS